MATFSNSRAVYGLISTGTHTKSRVANDVEVGISSTSLALTGATKAYVISATLATVADTLTIDTETGIATVGTAPVSQIETATAVGTITGSGNATVVVTGARITGSPITLSVAVLDTDTAATWAGKVRTALLANTAITSVYTVGGASATISLTETSAENNDATLNISLDNGTCTGITTAASSANSTAGVGGVKLTNNTGDGKDFEGISLGTMIPPSAILIRSISGAFSYAWGVNNFTGELLAATAFNLFVSGGANDDLVITAMSACEVEITIFV